MSQKLELTSRLINHISIIVISKWQQKLNLKFENLLSIVFRKQTSFCPCLWRFSSEVANMKPVLASMQIYCNLSPALLISLAVRTKIQCNLQWTFLLIQKVSLIWFYRTLKALLCREILSKWDVECKLKYREVYINLLFLPTHWPASEAWLPFDIFLNRKYRE